jgi:exonuclease III
MAKEGYAVMAIVDTHLKPGNHKSGWLSRTFDGYALYFNTWNPTKQHQAQAGVMLAINKYVARGAIQRPFRSGSRGRILEVTIDTPGESGRTTLIATYAPHTASPMENTEGETHGGYGGDTPTDPVTVHTRNLSAAVRDARHRGDDVLLAGDHNAVIAPADRTGAMSRRDKEWTEWMTANGMQTAGRADADKNTHSFQAENDSATSSKIDDWITASGNRATLTDTKVVHGWAHGSDHEPVSARVQGWAVDNMNNTTPDWSRPTIERINLPKAEDREKMTQKIWDNISGELATVSQLVMAEGTLAEEGIAEAETMVNNMMQKGMEVVKDMWGLQTQAKQGKPGNGNTPWLPRTKATAYKENMTTAKKLRALTT